jgi:hypothetical protein
VRQFARSNSSPQPKAIETETGKARGGTLVTLSLTLSAGMLGKMWEIEQLAGLDLPESTPESICALWPKSST